MSQVLEVEDSTVSPLRPLVAAAASESAQEVHGAPRAGSDLVCRLPAQVIARPEFGRGEKRYNFEILAR